MQDIASQIQMLKGANVATHCDARGDFIPKRVAKQNESNRQVDTHTAKSLLGVAHAAFSIDCMSIKRQGVLAAAASKCVTSSQGLMCRDGIMSGTDHFSTWWTQVENVTGIAYKTSYHDEIHNEASEV